MRICLISSVHLWMNPRLVKEADALLARGHQVFVVTRRIDAWSDVRDAELVATRRWSVTRINLLRHDRHGQWPWLASAVQAELAGHAYRRSHRLRDAERWYYRGFGRVLSAAISTRADFFIAHTQGALPIAAQAAARTGARYGFDCEDLLAEEAADGLRGPDHRQSILDIERGYLPDAAYVTATSFAMATHLAVTHNIPRPLVVHNVFPLADLDGVRAPEVRPTRPTVELVWVSATLGAGRGLEDALLALGRLPRHTRLTIIARLLPEYEPEFAALVGKLGLASRVQVAPVVEADRLLPALAEFDVGLSLDRNTCLNRSLTICNKVFLYLQAGLAVAATDTPGHREVLDAIPRAGFMYTSGRSDQLAEGLGRLVDERDALVAAKRAAWQAGQRQWNWDRERGVFLGAVEDRDQYRSSEASARAS